MLSTYIVCQLIINSSYSWRVQQLRNSTRSLTLELLGRPPPHCNCNAPHLTSAPVFTGEFHSESFNVTLFFSLSSFHTTTLAVWHISYVTVSPVYPNIARLKSESRDARTHTPSRLSTSKYAYARDSRVCMQYVRAPACSLVQWPCTATFWFSWWHVTDDGLVANEISPSLYHRLLLLPSSAFIRYAHYRTCYIALCYGYVRSSASCSVIMSNSW